MSGTAWRLVVGAVLELAGIGLVGVDVYVARRTRDALSKPPIAVQIDPAEEHDVAMLVSAVGGRRAGAKGVEERIAALEAEHREIRARLDASDERAVRAYRDHRPGWGMEARRDASDVRSGLMPMIGAAAAGNVRNRALGAALFAVGLVVQSVANVIAL